MNIDKGGWMIVDIEVNTFYLGSFCSYIDENEISGVIIFPNPTTDRVFIQNTFIDDIISVSLTDMYGKIVLQDDVVGNDGISLQTLASGIYFLQMRTSEKDLGCTKLIKQ